jgi:hypothetical protein
VTKSGEIAGPRVLEHIVDVVLYMEVGTLLPSLFWIVGQFGTWSCYSLLFCFLFYLHSLFLDPLYTAYIKLEPQAFSILDFVKLIGDKIFLAGNFILFSAECF